MTNEQFKEIIQKLDRVIEEQQETIQFIKDWKFEGDLTEEQKKRMMEEGEVKFDEKNYK